MTNSINPTPTPPVELWSAEELAEWLTEEASWYASGCKQQEIFLGAAKLLQQQQARITELMMARGTYGLNKVKPIAVTELKPGPKDCIPNPRNGEGHWCWGWRQWSPNLAFSGRWSMLPLDCVIQECTHWLPAHALPIPTRTEPIND